MAKSQFSSGYNSCSNNSSKPHSPRLNNWQSNRSSDWSSDSYIGGTSDNLSHPHSPGLIPSRAMGPSGKSKEAAQTSTILRRTMARSHKAAAAAAQAAKDRQFRAFQEELGLSLDNDGEALAPSTPQKAAARRPAAQSPQQRDGGAPGKQAAQVEPDTSSLVPIPTLPPHLQTLVTNSFGPAGQDARSTKLPVSPGPLCSPYIKSPPCRSRSRD